MPPRETTSAGLAEAELWQRRAVLWSWRGRTERTRRNAVLATRLLLPRFERRSLGESLRAWSNLAHGQAGKRGAGSESGDAASGLAESLRQQKELRDQLEKLLAELDRARLAAHNANRAMLSMRRQRIADASLDEHDAPPTSPSGARASSGSPDGGAPGVAPGVLWGGGEEGGGGVWLSDREDLARALSETQAALEESEHRS